MTYWNLRSGLKLPLGGSSHWDLAVRRAGLPPPGCPSSSSPLAPACHQVSACLLAPANPVCSLPSCTALCLCLVKFSSPSHLSLNFTFSAHLPWSFWAGQPSIRDTLPPSPSIYHFALLRVAFWISVFLPHQTVSSMMADTCSLELPITPPAPPEAVSVIQQVLNK